MHSNDMKNFLLAGFSTSPATILALDTKTLITVISAIVLPVLFFAIGKTIDVCLQLHFKRRERMNTLLIEATATKIAKESTDEN